MSLADLGDALRRRREDAEAFAESVRSVSEEIARLPTRTTPTRPTAINIADSVPGTDTRGRGGGLLLLQAGSSGTSLAPVTREEVAEEVATVVEQANYVQTRNLAEVMRESMRQNTPTIAAQLLPSLAMVFQQAMRDATPTIAQEVRKVITATPPAGVTPTTPFGEKCGGGIPIPLLRWSGALR